MGNKISLVIATAFLALSTMAQIALAQTPAQVTNLTSILCSIVADVRLTVGILAIVLFVIGGILYAASHFMPASGNIRSGFQGWGMAMILGGIIGLILVIIAPFIVAKVASFASSSASIATNC
ncbi:MAG: hypothetical protein QXL16_02120 [Candidatus Micrarchaeaceae archaeon]